MGKRHITAEFLERALRGDAGPAEIRELSAHILEGCPECDAFIEGMSADDLEVLYSFFIACERERSSAKMLSREDKDDIYDKIELTKAAKSQSHRQQGVGRARGLRRLFLPIAAVFVAAVGTLLLYNGDAVDKYMKGSAEKTLPNEQVSLIFSVYDSDAEGLQRGVNNGIYSQDDRILFRFRLAEPGTVQIIRSFGKEEHEVIYKSGEELLPGFYDAADGDKLFAYPLEELAGKQTFCAVYSRETETDELFRKLKGSFKEPDGQKETRWHETPWLDCFVITVEGAAKKGGPSFSPR